MGMGIIKCHSDALIWYWPMLHLPNNPVLLLLSTPSGTKILIQSGVIATTFEANNLMTHECSRLLEN